jgi:hypothetical protein
MLVTLGTLATFSFYQWMQPCTSALTFFLSVSVVAFILAMLSTASFIILHISRRQDGVQRLYSKDHTYARRWGSMYDTLKEGQLYFAPVLWIVVLIRSAIIGFGQGSGLAQVIALIALDFCISLGECRHPTFVIYITLRPCVRFVRLSTILQPGVQQGQLSYPRDKTSLKCPTSGLC